MVVSMYCVYSVSPPSPQLNLRFTSLTSSTNPYLNYHLEPLLFSWYVI